MERNQNLFHFVIACQFFLTGCGWVTYQIEQLSQNTDSPTLPTINTLISGTPSGASNSTDLAVSVSGTDVTAYKFKVGPTSSIDCSDASGYSDEIPINQNITSNISAITDGSVTLCVIGKDIAGNYQAFSSATTATWIKDTSLPLILKKIAVGTSKTMAITTTGVAQSWGSNYEDINGVYGQLGLGLSNATSFNSPQTLDDAGTSYLSIVSGEIQSCGLTSTQSIKCWGDNIGDGSGLVKYSPTLISDDGSTKYVDITSGSYHICAVTSAGEMKCWGDGWQGKLGTGNGNGQSAPVTAIPGTKFKMAAAGSNHTCGITDTNAVLCWGTNSSGQTGDGTKDSPRLTPVTADPGVSYATIAAGEDSTCGITTTGVLKCWGANGRGQLGDNSLLTRPTPTVIDPGTTYSKIAMSATFYFHSCGITTAGVLKCWGYNNYGQLGNGSTTDSLVPIEIDPGVQYREVSVTYGSTCGITTGGSLKCWGANSSGQLGLGHTNSQYTPALVGNGY